MTTVRKSQPRIMIAGGDSWYSKGDLAILEGSLAMLGEELPGAQLSILSGRPEITRTQFPAYRVIPRNKPSLLWKELGKTDLFLWGGGQLIQNISSQAFYGFQLFIINLALARSKHVMSFALGTAELQGSHWQSLTAAALNRFDVLAVRDQGSATHLNAIGVKKPIQVTADAALILRAIPGRALELQEKESLQKPYITIAPRAWFHYRFAFLPSRKVPDGTLPTNNPRFQKTVTELVETINRLAEEKGICSVLIPMYPGHGQNDEIVSEIIAAKVNRPGIARVIRGDYSPGELVSIFECGKINIGIRLHSAILAACAGIPSLCPYSQEKGKYFLEQLGLDDFATPLIDFSPEWAMERLSKVLYNEDYYRDHLAAMRTVLSIKARENARLARMLIES